MRRSRVALLHIAAVLILGLASGEVFAAEPPDNATVSFGQWMTSPPLDRFPNFYEDGTLPGDIDSTVTTMTTNPMPPIVPIIDDPDGRIYRGLDPTLQSSDRVEVVNFAEPGIYLVICGIRPHFLEGMYGFVRVLPN